MRQKAAVLRDSGFYAESATGRSPREESRIPVSGKALRKGKKRENNQESALCKM